LLVHHFAREEFELKDGRRAAAAKGGALLRILDFEFLSRSVWPNNQWRNLPRWPPH